MSRRKIEQMLSDGVVWGDIAAALGVQVNEAQAMARPSRNAGWFSSCSTTAGEDSSKFKNSPQATDFARMAGLPNPKAPCQGWYSMPGDGAPLGHCPRCVKAARIILERDDPESMPRTKNDAARDRIICGMIADLLCGRGDDDKEGLEALVPLPPVEPVSVVRKPQGARISPEAAALMADRDEMIERAFVDDVLTPTECGARFGVGAQRVREILSARGVVRSRSMALRLRPRYPVGKYKALRECGIDVEAAADRSGITGECAESVESGTYRSATVERDDSLREAIVKMHSDGMDLDGIAAEVGVTRGVVSSRLADVLCGEAATLYADGDTIMQVADAVGVSKKTARRWILRAGGVLRCERGGRQA